jgi:hypothetical protein
MDVDITEEQRDLQQRVRRLAETSPQFGGPGDSGR